MKRVLATCGFAFSCLGSVFFATCYVLAIRGGLPGTVGPWPIVIASFLCLGVWIPMAYRPIGEAPWQPVLRLTSLLMKLTRTLLGIALGLAAVSLLWVLRERSEKGQPSREVFTAFLMSLMLLHMAYSAAHWAIRPENIFPAGWIHWWSSPNRLLVRIYRRRRLNRLLAERGDAKR
jgi:hypothetical protein